MVVDASFILAYLLPDEVLSADALIKRFKAGQAVFFSTQLLPFEVLNSLKNALKQKRITAVQAGVLSRRFLEMEIELLPVKFEEVFELAEKKNLTIYDAGYLWLARNKKVKLQTLDKQLKKIAA
ncbi:hypothetical protein A3I57_02005 [Candidatus Beckwithbacteria bacterium RIFCSPLOWO2_02_FULL_47_23]|uniref:PIN domain-containing protein n=2 Tax=Candidatus Beckwithiibacteriota TaxID=1752726 RepID=A0A1F5DVY6_9BACT|nr:MAG: hypothetical protein A3E73_00260 [Candidatus Beckwithbacteria bacterium RIFCSPHIGHO2_12_FULL_47_17]OGD59292.1 MAG: hypothetical protein A3I57_02005 [Candidatus Beckwithbacteria bacterium RIFCSPLOWO2_02_FULL_47_23]